MENILEIEKNLSNWFVENDYKGHDPYQLDEKASGLINKIPLLKYTRKALKPFHVFIPKSTFSSFPKIYHPKALGLIIGGNSYLYRITGNIDLLDQNEGLIELLKQLSNKDYKHYTWGSPFEWGCNPRYSANTPAVPLIVPIANALLDFYDVAYDKEALELSSDIAQHIVEENGYREIDNCSVCLYYSPVDRNEVYNTNALAASFLFRLNSLNGNNTQLDLAKRICGFILNAQLSDGSWVYSSSSKVIDNRHTGYILESLASILKFWDDKLLEEAYVKGMYYYNNNLIESGLPRWSPANTYPIDIHDVAQSIITYTEIGDIKKAKYIVDFAITKMSNGKDEFYFKYFKNGKVNRNVFIRWGQAWMYYALGKFLFNYYNTETSRKTGNPGFFKRMHSI